MKFKLLKKQTIFLNWGKRIFNGFAHAKAPKVLLKPKYLGQLGFTLAEVLITLGIIGVVAALTIPTLISNHEKKVTAVQLKKFYSVMNQAIKLEEVEYGDAKTWLPEDKSFEKWYLLHFDKHIQSVYKGTDNTSPRGDYNVAFKDGSGFSAYIISPYTIHFFYCIKYKNCGAEKFDGKHTFLFTISNGKLITSSSAFDNFSRQELLNSCKNGNYDDPDVNSQGRRHACTRLIEYDGWEIAKDYPWKQAPPKEK